MINDLILVNRRNFLVPDKLAIATVPPKGEEISIQWTELTQPPEIEGFDSLTYHYLDLTSPDETEEFRKSFFHFFGGMLICFVFRIV